MDTTTARNLALDLMTEHGLIALGWTFAFDRAKTRAGNCAFGPKRITMSESYVRLNVEAEIRDTILHEIAHAHAGFKAGHGPAWRRMALAIGCNGERCTTAEVAVEKGRYEARCDGDRADPHVAAHYHRRPGKNMLQHGICRRHARRLTWFDTVSQTYLGTLVDVSTLRIASVTYTPVAAAAAQSKPEPAWVTGSSDWDKMWGDD